MRAAQIGLFVIATVSLLSSAVAQSPVKSKKNPVVNKVVVMRHVGARTTTPVTTKKSVKRSSARRFAKVQFRHR